MLEFEKWEQAFVRIPSSLQEAFGSYLANSKGEKYLSIMKLLSLVDYDLTNSENLLRILLSNSEENIETCMKTFFSLEGDLDCLRSSIHLFSAILPESLHQLLKESEADIVFLLSLVRHTKNSSELEQMAVFIQTISPSFFIHLIKLCNELKSEHCRLCRLRRLNDLEGRMHRTELKDINVSPKAHESSDSKIWQAPDSKDFVFKFILDKGAVIDASIFYHSSSVNMVQICDTCLGEVYAAIVSAGRREEIHHLNAQERHAAVQRMRQNERNIAYLMKTLSNERLKRRAKEMITELLKRKRRSDSHLLRQRKENEISANKARAFEENAIIKTKLLQDSSDYVHKWRAADAVSTGKCLQRKQELAALNHHPFYGDLDGRRHKEPIREHDLSCRLVAYDLTPEGYSIPVTPASAAAVFGTAVFETRVDRDELTALREANLATMKEYEMRLQEKNRLKMEAQLHEREFALSYVQNRLDCFERKEQRILFERQLKEADRITARKAEKAARREARLRANEEWESDRMVCEDMRAAQLRYDWSEHQRQKAALFSMRKQEHIQCLVDRFWGFDLAERLRREEEIKRKQYYDNLVERLRVTCVQVKIIKPSIREVKERVFRDRLSGRVLS